MGSTLPASWLSSVGKVRDLSHCLVTGLGQSCLPYLQPCHGGLTAQKALTDVCMYGAHLKGKVLWVLRRSGKCITCLEATLGPAMFFSLSLLFPAGASLWGPLLETTSGDYPWGTIPGDHSWGDHPFLSSLCLPSSQALSQRQTVQPLQSPNRGKSHTASTGRPYLGCS